MGVSLNGGTPKSSILIGFSIINHPYWGTTILGKPHVVYPSDLSWPCAHPPEGWTRWIRVPKVSEKTFSKFPADFHGLMLDKGWCWSEIQRGSNSIQFGFNMLPNILIVWIFSDFWSNFQAHTFLEVKLRMRNDPPCTLFRSFLETCQLCKETRQNKYTYRMTT